MVQPSDELLGQERMAGRFLLALSQNTLSHAMILLGPEGSGKSTLADYFARALLCTGTNVPCGNCGACIRVQTGNHPDLHWLRPARPGAFRVEDADALQKILSVRPYEGGKRVIIVPDAQRINQEAQNKLLKILEEPPEDTYIFLLATTLASFLPTVLSRCTQFNLDRMDAERLRAYLERECPGETGARVKHALAASQGWPVRARDLLQDENYWITRNEYADCLMKANTLQGKLNLCSRFMKKKEDLLAALDVWEWMLRDACLMPGGIAPIEADLESDIRELTRMYKPEELLSLWKAMQDARNALAQNASTGMTLDALMAAWSA